MYNIVYSNRAKKDSKKVEIAGLKEKVVGLLKIVKTSPFLNPPPYEKLQGYNNRYSRRINQQHRLVYAIVENEIIILQMWSHYE
ncbi:MAG: Txe/YoeB family addiction module toxin [Bacteroidetes bacterium]|nr:Txe/YoeB family addiction module toxin [Bacteroidota bacterium]